MSSSREALMDAELARLAEEGKALDREWRRVPLLFAFVVTAAPAYWIWGPLAALYAVLFTPALVGTAAYLVGVRRRENRELHAELKRERKALATE
ncbi:MAG: hypothetical protein KC619_32105 [Myxococcales bacterium]|nr:hypothetical protein [Myxococcales bacterium]